MAFVMVKERGEYQVELIQYSLSWSEDCYPLATVSTGWMQSDRSGRTRTFVAHEGNAVTARRNCCSATLRNMGARAGFAPAIFSLWKWPTLEPVPS